MEKVLLVVGVALLLCALVAGGLYGWHGQWGPVLLMVFGAFVGKMILGLIELLLTPLSLPAIHFAKRGNDILSTISMAIFAIGTRSLYAAYCATILVYLIETPGPPLWLAIVLAIAVASAPFHWAASQASDDHPKNLDPVAAMFGVLLSGACIAVGAGTMISLVPLAFLFLISAAMFCFWWNAIGMRAVRLQYLVDGGHS